MLKLTLNKKGEDLIIEVFKDNFVANNKDNLDKKRNKFSIFYENYLFNYLIKCLLIQNFINELRTKEVYSKLK